MRPILIQTAFVLMLLTTLFPIVEGTGESIIGSGYDGQFTLPDIEPFDWTDWDQDLDMNRIDDLLQGDWVELDGMDGRIGINIHLNLPVTVRDLDIIYSHLLTAGLEPEVHGIGRYSTAIYLTISNQGSNSNLPRLPWVEMIEYRPVMVNSLDISSPATRSRASGDYTPMTAEDLGYTGQGMVVAVIDSGVDNSVHESLRGKYVYGVDFTGTTSIPGLDPDDIDGHGTHVAGTVMGTGGSTGRYKGTAPDADLVDLRYARVQGDFTGAADRALEWVIENHEEFDIRVVSCSWGSTVFTSGRDTTSRLVNQLVDEGVVVVVASGNDGSQGMSSPAAADNALTVGALSDHVTIDRDDDTYADFSNYGPRQSDGDLDAEDELKPDLISPGVRIRAPKHNSIIDYVDASGTSMATPHVSGIVALMLEANPDLTPRDVKLIIRDTAQQRYETSRSDIDPKYNYYSGWGAVDSYGATKRAQDLLDFGLVVPEEVRLNDPFDLAFAGQFTKTTYDTVSDEILMEVRTPGDWGVPTNVEADADSISATTSISGPFLLGTEWVIRARMRYNDSTEEATPRLFASIRPLGRVGETRTFHGSVSINSIQGTVEPTNATIVYDSLPPDLSVTPMAVWISETRPEGGDRITITARINNTGSTDVYDAVVRFIDGPQRTGTLIGDDTIDVPGGGFGIAEVEWEANPGLHAITIVADPANEIDESNEDNNTAERPVSVLGFNPPPVAQLDVSPPSGTTITEFTFDGSSSTDTNIRGGTVVSYNFDFGDGTSSGWTTDSVVTHYYSVGGVFSASLAVKDNGGAESTNPADVQINVTGINSDELDLYLNGNLGLSPVPNRSVPFTVPYTLVPNEVGTWTSEPLERTMILHSAVRTALVINAPMVSSIELEMEITGPDESYLERFIVEHGGDGVNETFHLTMDMQEMEVKYLETFALRISAGSNNSGGKIWAGEGGSTSNFLFYYPLNQVPEADAGEDLEIKAGTEVTFSGTASDIDGMIAGIRWDVDSDGTWEFESDSVMDFRYSGYSQEGQYTARFEVVDDDGFWVHDSLKVLVRSQNYNYPPQVTITCPSEPLTGESIIEGTASDDDGIESVEVRLEDDGPYGEWSETKGAESWYFEMDTRTLENGIYTIFARSYDGDRYSQAASCQIEVNNPNSPPEFIRIIAAPRPIPIDGDTRLLIKAEVDDPDLPGDSLSIFADLTAIGGPQEVVLYDNGVDPDFLRDDNEFTLEFLPPVEVAPGIHEVLLTVVDRYGSYTSEKVEVELYSETECKFSISEDEVVVGSTIHVEVRIDTKVPIGKVEFLSEILGEDGRIELLDDGRNGDRIAGDSIYSRNIIVGTIPGIYNYSVEVTCTSGDKVFLINDQLEVLRDTYPGPRLNEIWVVTMAIVGIIIVVMVMLIALVFLTRSPKIEPVQVYQDPYTQQDHLYAAVNIPVEAVLIARELD